MHQETFYFRQNIKILQTSNHNEMINFDSAYGHSYNSERSSIVQMITFLILAGDQNEWYDRLKRLVCGWPFVANKGFALIITYNTLNPI